MTEDIFWYHTLMERRRLAFGNASALQHYRFDADNGRVPQLEEARKYYQNFSTMARNNLGLLFWGQPGTGKTFAAACIANAMIDDRGDFPTTVRMATFGTILTALLAKSPQEKEEYIEDLCTCGLLILDDFGMERQTEYAREQVFQIVDGRYLARMPMIVTTNLSLNQLKNPEDMVQKRIYDRVLEMCVPVCFSGESLRQGRAKENLQLYRQLTGRA